MRRTTLIQQVTKRVSSSLLPVARFSTHSFAAPERHDAWRSLVSAVFEPTPPSGRQWLDLQAEVQSVHFGHALVVRATAESQHFTRTRRLIATEGLDHYLIQVYRRGVCDGTYGETQNTVRPGDIKVIDLTQPFHTLNTDFDNTTLTLPRVALAPLLAQPDSMHGTVLHRESPLARVLAAHIHALSEVSGTLSTAEGIALAAGTARLVAACLGAGGRAREETLPYRVDAIGQAVRDFIDRNITLPELGPDLLARRFRMSRAQIYRLFTEEHGVAAYIQARRLHHCFLAITNPAQANHRINEIAFDFGFTSEAHFSRAFRRTFGVSPTEARLSGTLAVPSGPGTFVNDWMRALQRGAATPAQPQPATAETVDQRI